MTYLITCSGLKKSVNPDNSIVSNLEQLSFHQELGHFRNQMIHYYEEHFGGNLDWTNTVPAYKLYNGKLYSRISVDNWQKNCIKLRILSALFGWINYYDYIPTYNLAMNQIIPNLGSISEIWYDYNVLNNPIFFDSVNDIDLMSIKYRKAVIGNLGNHNSIALTPNIQWTDKYGSHKGNWLNQQLNQIVC